MWAVNMLPVWALPSIELIQKCQTRRRIVDVAKGKRNKRSQPVGSLDGWCDSLGGRRQPVYIWHPAPESAQDVTQRPVQRGQSGQTLSATRARTAGSIAGRTPSSVKPKRRTSGGPVVRAQAPSWRRQLLVRRAAGD